MNRQIHIKILNHLRAIDSLFSLELIANLSDNEVCIETQHIQFNIELIQPETCIAFMRFLSNQIYLGEAPLFGPGDGSEHQAGLKLSCLKARVLLRISASI